jgi:hypothetical protein
MTFLEAAQREYQALLFMLTTAYPCITERGLSLKRAGDLREAQKAQDALTFLLEATLEALNTHVDAAIAACAIATKSETVATSDFRRHRDDHIGVLESRFLFERGDLPGWDAVKLTKHQSNAVKHRLGLTMRTGITTALQVEDEVELSEPALLERIDDVHKWVTALGNICGLR